MKNLTFTEKVLLAVAGVIFLWSIGPRFIDIQKFLPYYSIDENDVVEWAVGFLGGDWNPNWFGYGSLTPYLLAICYKIQYLFSSSSSIEEFAGNVFFDSSPFYYTARMLNSLGSVALIFITYFLVKIVYDRKTAFIAALLACVPLAEVLTAFTIRVDTILAVTSTLAILFVLKAFEAKNKVLMYSLSGLMVGLGFATKTLPGLLVLPTLGIAHYLINYNELKESGKKNDIVSTLIASVSSKPLFFMIGAGFIGLIIGSPYSIMDFGIFWDEQIMQMETQGKKVYAKGYDMAKFSDNYGWPFVIITFLASIHAILNKRSQKQMVFYSYAAVFWLAFAKGSARTYFYIPMIPIILGILANLFSDLSQKIKDEKLQSLAIIVLSGIILFKPVNDLLEQQANKNAKNDYVELHTQCSAQKWIENNINQNTKILYYGYYTSLPKLIDPDQQEQMNYGEHFMYNRIKNEFLKSTFSTAHKKYVAEEKPTYQLMSFLGFKYQGQDIRWNLRYGIRKEEFPLFLNVLPQTGVEYIVASTYPTRHKSMNLLDVPQLNQKVVAQFSAKDYPYGREVTIYKVK